MIHVILYTSAESQAGDGMTVGPFASTDAAAEFLQEFKQTRRPNAHGVVFERMMPASEALYLFRDDDPSASGSAS